MTYSEEQVEWIVVEVLRRLRVAQPEQNTVAGEKTLRIADRVVTMKVIEGRLSGVDQVVVQKRAVVTPSVKDELRKRKIELNFEGAKH
jgi:ethanolamine utilization cobalamin adenosyltransferase